MKTSFSTFKATAFATLFVLVTAMLVACKKEETPVVKKPDQQASEAAVRELEKEEIKAILAKDLDKLRAIWAPDFTVNSPLLHGLVKREQVLAMTQNDVISYARFERNIEHVTFIGDVIVTMGEEILEPQNNNPDAGKTIKRRFTNVWSYRDGKWVETNRHAHIVPQ